MAMAALRREGRRLLLSPTVPNPSPAAAAARSSVISHRKATTFLPSQSPIPLGLDPGKGACSYSWERSRSTIPLGLDPGKGACSYIRERSKQYYAHD